MKLQTRGMWLDCLLATDAPRCAYRVAGSLHWRTSSVSSQCWPSYNTIAQDINMDPQSVKRGIAWLRDNGWIKVTKRPGHTGWDSNLYTMTFPRWPGDISSMFSPKQLAKVKKPGVVSKLYPSWYQSCTSPSIKAVPLSREENKGIEPPPDGMDQQLSFSDYISKHGRLPQ